ncbi:MAG: acetyl-CoA hydrolase/transferase family protein [Bacteroidia bacterium]|nr:acetyl-CoA hydrolase/transferase family protein [Bacteroidia bacterium]
MYKSVSAREAVKIIKSGDRVFIHSAAAAPQILIDAMVERAPELRNVEVIHLHTECKATYAKPEFAESFRVNSLFIGSNVRKATNEGRADYIPIFLSEVPLLFRRGMLPVNVALIQVSPPDHHGYCSLGISVDTTLAVVETAQHVIAVINPKMPRALGDGMLHLSDLHTIVEDDTDLAEMIIPPPDEVQKAIGMNVAGIIEDGATLQMGIGAIPNAVLASLHAHKDLGCHTEMFSDGIIDLVEKGILTGKYKKKHKGVISAGFAMGSRKLYDFIHDNPMVRMLDIAYVNDVSVIRKFPRMTAINSAIEVDLTGQVCADSIGTSFYSGVGGQMDFIRGASLCEEGKAIIALPSTTSHGESRIVPFLKKGAGVVTSRANVHYLATEYGVVNLFGKNIRERAKLLIEIAHPAFQEQLEREFFMELR